MLKDWMIRILLIVVPVWAFFYFYSVGVSQFDGYKKFRIQTKKEGAGFSIRMKSEGWEIWRVKHKVEISKVFPPQSDAAANSEAAAKTTL